jgi:5,10-methylenetetrahydromethanopterin reductase
MQFGFLLFQRDLEAVGAAAALGEQQGFDLVGLVDSPTLAYDPYVALTLAALSTQRARIGTAVTNPRTRHPLILANLAASLERVAPGRTFLGLGTGNSGVAHAGAAPATLDALAETVEIVRRLLAGQPASAHGAELVLKIPCSPVPIMLAASGPRSLRLAGRVADVVFFNLGATPEHVRQALGWIAEGAEAAGRDPATVESWLYTPAAVAPDRALAQDEVRNAAVSSAVFVLKRDAASKEVPPELADRIEQLVRDYDWRHHLTPGRTPNYELVERLGLVDYVLGRFSISGTPEDCRRRLAELRAAGLRNICFNLSPVHDLPAMLSLYGVEVLPPIRSELA